MLRATA